MNCIKCGRALRAGAKACPYCGTPVPAYGGKGGTEFDWTLKGDTSQPQPRPKAKKPERTFTWDTGTGAARSAGRPAATTSAPSAAQAPSAAPAAREKRWTEPEEARQLFSFDKEHAALQQQVDQRVEKIAAERPAPAVERERREDLFVLPSEMTMDDFSDLLGESLIRESSRVLVVNQREKEPPKPPSNVYDPDPLGDAVTVSAPARAVEAETVDRGAERQPETEPVRMARPLQETVNDPAGMPEIPVEEIPRIPPKRKKPKQRSPEDQAYDPFQGKEYMVYTPVPVFISRRQPKKVPSRTSSGKAANTGPDGQVLDFGKLQNLAGDSPDGSEKEGLNLSLSAIDPGYTPEEEKRAIESFQNLLHAEEAFSKKVDQFTFLSGKEGEEAEEAWRRREEAVAEPKVSFISIEDEYQKYREDHEPPSIHMIEGRSSKNRETGDTEESADTPESESRETTAPGNYRKRGNRPVRIVRHASDRKGAQEEAAEPALTIIPEESASGEHEAKTEEASETVAAVTSSSREGKKKSRELNIKINEPSGTQFTVRTQEVNLADQASRLRDTQEVDLSKLKEGPKSVRVQVEVNHNASSSSVEVTRADDGSTVVRTVEEGEENERRYDAEGEDFLYRVPRKESFWEKNELPATRITLTDVFSPEMMEFKENWEQEEQNAKQPSGTAEESPESDPSAGEDRIDQFLSSELEKAEALETEEPEGTVDTADTAETTETRRTDGTPETDNPEEASQEPEDQETAAGESTVEESENGEKTDAADDSEEAREDIPDSEQPPEPETDLEETDDSVDMPEAEAAMDEASSEDLTEPEETGEPEETEVGDAAAGSSGQDAQTPETGEAEAAEPSEETPDEDGDDDGQSSIRRAGRIRFRYGKSKSSGEETVEPEDDAEAQQKPEEEPGTAEKPDALHRTMIVEKISEETEAEAGGEEQEAGEMQGLFSSLNHIRHRIAGAIGTAENEEVSGEDAPEADEKAVPEKDRKEREDAAPEERPVRKRISAASVMSVIIAVLIIAIVIEFAVITIRLVAPNSQGAVLIKRIEQTISGKKPNFVIEAEAQLSDGSIVELSDGSDSGEEGTV